MSKQNLYNSIKNIRESEKQPYQRILIAGYLNDEEKKANQINAEQYLKNSVKNHLEDMTGYLYIKGLFYLHLLESNNIKHINKYVKQFHTKNCAEYPKLHNKIRIVHQSYENGDQLFKNWDSDYVSAQGPVLIETDKTQQQIADRSYEIYQNLQDGAKKKKQNPGHKIANMFLLSNDDMSILICEQFMSIEQYSQLYLEDYIHGKEAEQNYPLPPSIFSIMDFLEIEDYRDFKGK